MIIPVKKEDIKKEDIILDSKNIEYYYKISEEEFNYFKKINPDSEFVFRKM